MENAMYEWTEPRRYKKALTGVQFCFFPTCNNNIWIDPNMKCFNLPNDIWSLTKWCIRVGKLEWLEPDRIEKVKKNIYFCNQHFHDNMFLDEERTHLSVDAVPNNVKTPGIRVEEESKKAETTATATSPSYNYAYPLVQSAPPDLTTASWPSYNYAYYPTVKSAPPAVTTPASLFHNYAYPFEQSVPPAVTTPTSLFHNYAYPFEQSVPPAVTTPTSLFHNYAYPFEQSVPPAVTTPTSLFHNYAYPFERSVPQTIATAPSENVTSAVESPRPTEAKSPSENFTSVVEYSRSTAAKEPSNLSLLGKQQNCATIHTQQSSVRETQVTTFVKITTSMENDSTPNSKNIRSDGLYSNNCASSSCSGICEPGQFICESCRNLGVVACSVESCKKVFKNKLASSKYYVYFPKVMTEQSKWKKSLRIYNPIDLQDSIVCLNHFRPENFFKNSNVLKKNACPVINFMSSAVRVGNNENAQHTALASTPTTASLRRVRKKKLNYFSRLKAILEIKKIKLQIEHLILRNSFLRRKLNIN